MDGEHTIVIVAIVTIVIIAIIALIFYSTGAATVTHTLSYITSTGGFVQLYSGTSAVVVSSNSIDTIIFATPAGTSSYNINTGITTAVNSIVPIGLAYNGSDFLFLEQNGDLYLLKSMILTKSNVTSVVDTIGGYGLTIAGVTYYVGSKVLANGNYGPIQLKIT